MYLYRVLAGTFSHVQFGQDAGISNDRFRQFLLFLVSLIKWSISMDSKDSVSMRLYSRNKVQSFANEMSQ